MKLLALETSSISASAALYEDSCLLGEFFINAKLTHSQTILPMTRHLLSAVQMEIGEVDVFAAAAGPGSFTGLRIGLAAVKGMAHAGGKSCVAVSTLEGLAYNLIGTDGILCPVMDARCSQAYTALFSCKDGNLTRIREDCALSLDDLAEKLKGYDAPIFLVGDGAELCYNHFGKERTHISVAPEALRFGRASSIGLAAYKQVLTGNTITPQALAPSYIRLPQAERELNKKLKQEEIK